MPASSGYLTAIPADWIAGSALVAGSASIDAWRMNVAAAVVRVRK
jgi:hypothetical protein